MVVSVGKVIIRMWKKIGSKNGKVFRLTISIEEFAVEVDGIELLVTTGTKGFVSSNFSNSINLPSLPPPPFPLLANSKLGCIIPPNPL